MPTDVLWPGVITKPTYLIFEGGKYATLHRTFPEMRPPIEDAPILPRYVKSELPTGQYPVVEVIRAVFEATANMILYLFLFRPDAAPWLIRKVLRVFDFQIVSIYITISVI